MSRRESLARYSLIIRRLRKAPASFREIEDFLNRESELQQEDYNVSKRTFHRDINDIRVLYKIDIQYNAQQNVYVIDDEGAPEMNQRLLEAFDLLNSMNFTEGITSYIHFEKRRPQGTQHLYGLLDAIKRRLVVTLEYRKFWNDEVTSRTLHPYALKEFKNRWYLIALDKKDERIKVFGLDRISDLHVTQKKFSYPNDFSVAQMFANCFGIITPNDLRPQEILLSFPASQGKYIKSLPLHESQEILVDDDKELRIKLRLCLTHDFIMELLSYGEQLTVEAPSELRRIIKERHTEAAKNNK